MLSGGNVMARSKRRAFEPEELSVRPSNRSVVMEVLVEALWCLLVTSDNPTVQAGSVSRRARPLAQERRARGASVQPKDER